jgi:hypothetical protein
LATYGQKRLQSTVLFFGGKGHVWDPATLLWKENKDASLQQNFLLDTRRKVDGLITKIEELTLPVSESSSKSSKDDTKAFDEEKKAAIKKLQKLRSPLTTINKGNSLWGRIIGLLETQDFHLNRSSDTLPMLRGKKINLRTGEISNLGFQ